MYKNRIHGRNNICGVNIARMRQEFGGMLSQRKLAEDLSNVGLELDKNAIQRIESGQRFVTDIEMKASSDYFGITMDELMDEATCLFRFFR